MEKLPKLFENMSEKNNILHLLGAATGVLGALIC